MKYFVCHHAFFLIFRRHIAYRLLPHLKSNPYSSSLPLESLSRELISRVRYWNRELNEGSMREYGRTPYFINSRGRELNRVGFEIRECSGSDLWGSVVDQGKDASIFRRDRWTSCAAVRLISSKYKETYFSWSKTDT